MTDQDIKRAIVYHEEPDNMTPEEEHKYDAYFALWQKIISAFINDEDLTPINPKSN